MKRFLIFCFFSALFIANTPVALCEETHNSAQAKSPAIDGSLEFKVLGWAANCEKHNSSHIPTCSLPHSATSSSSNLVVDLAEVYEPGEADFTFKDFNFSNQELTIKGRITIYSVYPKVDSGLPPFTQIRIEISAPISALCIQSVRWRSPADIPTLSCANYDWSLNPAQQYGLTFIHIVR